MAVYKIRYKGLSDVRKMSADDLKKAGVQGIGGDLEWKPENSRVQYVENMSDRLREILEAEGTFGIEEVDDQTGESVKVITDGAALDDTVHSGVIKDSTTGQVSTNENAEPPQNDGVPSGTLDGGTDTTATAGDTGKGSST